MRQVLRIRASFKTSGLMIKLVAQLANCFRLLTSGKNYTNYRNSCSWVGESLSPLSAGQTVSSSRHKYRRCPNETFKSGTRIWKSNHWSQSRGSNPVCLSNNRTSVVLTARNLSLWLDCFNFPTLTRLTYRQSQDSENFWCLLSLQQVKLNPTNRSIVPSHLNIVRHTRNLDLLACEIAMSYRSCICWSCVRIT